MSRSTDPHRASGADLRRRTSREHSAQGLEQRPAPGEGEPPSLPPLTPAGREVLEVLWQRERPQTTRALHDAIARRYPERAGRRINTTSTLLVELMERGWVTGEKRGGSRWRYEAAVSRNEGLLTLARWAVRDLCTVRQDAWYLVQEALCALDLGELVTSAGRRGGTERRDAGSCSG